MHLENQEFTSESQARLTSDAMPAVVHSQAATSQEEAKDYAEAIVSALPIALMVLEADLRVRSASQLFYQTFHVVPEETEGRLIYELGNGQWNIPKLRTLLEEILPDNEIFLDYKVEHTFEEIGERTMLLNGRRLDDVQLILLIITDLTQGKHAEEALRSSEERFKMIARATQDVIWDVNMLTNTTWWSDDVEKVFSYTREELEQASGSWNNYIHPADVEEVLNSKAAATKRGDDSWRGEYRLLRKDGTIAYILERAFFMRDDQDISVRKIGSIVDLTERKQIEEALRVSEERFRQIAETIDDVFWIYAPETDHIIYASPQYETIFADSREALYQNPRSFQQYIHPDDLQKLKAALKRDVYSIHMDYRLLLPDGEIRWVNVRTFPVKNTSGTILYSVGIGRDITLLIQTGEQLQASEEQYRQLFANNPLPMWVYDYHSRQFLAVNEAAIAHYGYSEAEFLAMGLEDIRRDEDNKAQEAQWHARQLHLQNKRIDALWRHRKKDGTLIDVESVSDVIVFNGHKARIALANDVTTRLHAEARVREQAAMLDIAQDAIMVRDLDHRLTYWNHSAERLYGWSAAEVSGRRVDVLLHKDTDQFYRAHQQVMETGKWSGELVKIDRTGREILIEGRWTLVHDEEGKPRAILVTNTDISERKQLEAQYLRAQRMESIGTLAGGIAHDLNNVLAPILLSLGMLKRQSRSANELKLLNILETSAQHGAALVNQVLTFASGVQGERSVVNLGVIIMELQILIRDTFDRNIRVQVNIDDDLPTVLANPTQIHQVLLNLAINARDAMPQGGRLEVTASPVTLDSQYAAMNLDAKPGSYVLLSVSDSGTGIPATIRDRIFDPFFTTKEVGKGTGLGLANVQAMVKSHDGFINVYSEEGRGTEFKIYLPTFGGDVQDNLPTTTAIPAHQGQGELILVVDDDASVRLVTQQTLEVFGYRVVSAEDGAEAVAVYVQQKNAIAVVLTDMMMPVMDGFATIHALRKINPKVKIIATSGLTANAVASRAVNVGVKYFLEKPYTAEVLLKVLAKVLAEDSSAPAL